MYVATDAKSLMNSTSAAVDMDDEEDEDDDDEVEMPNAVTGQDEVGEEGERKEDSSS